MRKMMWITLVAAAAACGTGSGDGSDGTGGNGGGGGNAGASGGGGGVTTLPSTLAGTWELSGSSAGNVDGVLVLSSTSAHLTIGGGTFDLQAGSTPAFTWTGSNTPTFTVSHTPVAVDFGALPLAVGGDWTFTGTGGGSCVGSIRNDAASGGCSGAGRPPSPLPSLNRQVQVTHTSKLDSIFGALGGVWTLTDNGSGTCTFTFQGATLSASCKSGVVDKGGVTITFSDGMASGFTDAGAEFSAHRR